MIDQNSLAQPCWIGNQSPKSEWQLDVDQEFDARLISALRMDLGRCNPLLKGNFREVIICLGKEF